MKINILEMLKNQVRNYGFSAFLANNESFTLIIVAVLRDAGTSPPCYVTAVMIY